MADGFSVEVLCDSMAPSKKRLTTLVARYPRFIHSEVLTHRAFARNSASSRAIPWPKMMANIRTMPVIPMLWGSEQKGMQTGGEIDNPAEAERIWLIARDNAMKSAEALAELGVHKSLVNRLTEPFMWISTIISATEWNNFFRLRCHPDAEIHFQKIAGMIRDALKASTPVERLDGEWHLPLIQPDELDKYTLEVLCKVSTARCARVSYLTHDGRRDIDEDIKLFNRLANGSGFGHYSPFEMVAKASLFQDRSGPFIGWQQYRKQFPLENEPG